MCILFPAVIFPNERIVPKKETIIDMISNIYFIILSREFIILAKG